MIPVTLVKLDNYKGFLGSFDNISWWKTQVLPGAVDYVNNVIWVYGQYHVCSAKMIDGSYSIFQSKDNGFSWISVLNTFEIINLVFSPDYGIALVATSSGWWKSINSGTTWTKISSQAPNCFCVKELTNDILIALSSMLVWRSIDGGINWTPVFASATPIIYPALDGTYYDCIFGINGVIKYSSNGGTSFNTAAISGFETDGTPITNIVLTSTFGGVSGQVPTFIIQRKISSNAVRHFYAVRTPGSSASMFEVTARFDAEFNINNSIISDESQITGSASINKLVMFSGTENGFPLLKKSINAGYTWTDIDISNANIYSGPDLSQITSDGASFIDDVYFSASWSHNANCHNYWKIFDTHYEKNQSLDMDLITGPNFVTRTEAFLMDIMFQRKGYMHYTNDIRVLKTRINSITPDIRILKTCVKAITPDVRILKTLQKSSWYNLLLLKTINKGASFDIISVLRLTKNVTLDTLILKTRINNLIADILYKKLDLDNSYSMDILVQDTITDDILHNSERYNWQAPAIGLGYRKRAYPIFDSRRENKI